MTLSQPLRHWPAKAPLRAAPAALALAMLAACGGGDGDGTSPPVAGAYTVGGALSGLAASRSVTLQNNAGNDLQLSANGNFEFGTRLDHGVAYAVTVKTQPTGQRCTVAQGTGTATSNVSNVQVRCENLAAATYTVGGAVSGLTGSGLVLQNNGRDDLAVSANGGFSFATAQAGGTAYAVTVRTQPAGQSCTVVGGTGTVAAAHVTSVEVRCANSPAATGFPEGDWKQQACNQAGTGQWARSLWRVTRQADNRVSVRQGVVTFTDPNCTGAGTPREELMFDVGQFQFDRRDSTATLTAFWGPWLLPSGRTTRTIWALKGGYFCLLGGEDSLALPTAARVEEYTDVFIPSKACYTRN
ncbi:hypothetical protein [Paracidovorax sp. MALMAid1276]|uniref:hypothetical protein n=1 Tax=Paracidovorax sp. MALMAid1276 TaxID=3411631 RepID=UPI003B9C3A7D